MHTLPPYTLTCTTGGRCSVVVGCTVVWAWDTCLMIVVGVTCRAIMGVPGAWRRGGKKIITNTSVSIVKYHQLYLVFWFCIIANIKERIWTTTKLWEGFSVLNLMQLSKSWCTYIHIHFFLLVLYLFWGEELYILTIYGLLYIKVFNLMRFRYVKIFLMSNSQAVTELGTKCNACVLWKVDLDQIFGRNSWLWGWWGPSTDCPERCGLLFLEVPGWDGAWISLF